MSIVKRGLMGALAAGLMLLPACASKEKNTATGMASVQGNQQALSSTSESLEKAQSELSSFQGTLKELREEMAQNAGMRSRAQATESLNRLAINIQQAQLDLTQLREENRLATEDLNRRLRDAAAANTQVIEQGGTVRQAE